MKPSTIEILEEVATVLKRFVFRFLRCEVDPATYMTGLNKLMQRSVGNTMDCSKFYEVTPDDVKLSHVVKLIGAIDEQIKVNPA